MAGAQEYAKFQWEDPFLLDDHLTDDERMIRDTARAYAQDKLLPRVIEAYREEKTDREIFNEMGELGLLGVTLPEEYGCAGAVLRRLRPRGARGGAGRFRLPLHDERAVLARHVSDLRLWRRGAAQKYLPKLATGEWVGCFGLTEPDAGSDPAGMKTRAEKIDGGYRLTGSKMWISNSPIADVFVVWAKSAGA